MRPKQRQTSANTIYLDVVSRTCFDSYVAHKENSIDEAMIKFRGTLAFCQCLPAKPTKYGIKVWVSVNSTNGYACEIQVYAGCPPGVKTKGGLGKRVVLELTEKLIGKQSHIFLTIILIVWDSKKKYWKGNCMVMEQSNQM